jgi:hypothetical protein
MSASASLVSATSIEQVLSTLETPRVQSCSLFPYTINEQSELSILFRCNKMNSKQAGLYQEFGSSLKENEPNILFTAARSFLVKSGGLFFSSEIQNLSNPLEIKRIAKEFAAKGVVDLFADPKLKEMLREITTNRFTVHTEVLSQNHLAIFYPLPFFRIEPVNRVF